MKRIIKFGQMIKLSKPKTYHFKHFNFDMFIENGMADDNDLSDIVEIFLNSMPQSVDELKIAFSNRSFNTIGSIAHRMKPTVKMLHITEADPYVVLLCQLEKKPLPLPLIQNAIDIIDNAISNVAREMRQFQQ